MAKEALVILAEGFEEIETASIVDILRRAEIDVTLAGLEAGPLTGSRGMKVVPDCRLEDYDRLPDAVILPGGSEGARNLSKSERVADILKKADSENRIVAAICASPAVVLAPLSLLDGRKATCYPGLEEQFSPETQAVEEPAVSHGNLITGQGPGTALAFSLALVRALVGEETADRVAEELLYRK